MLYLDRSGILIEGRRIKINKTKIREAEQLLTVDIEKLSAMLSCGHATARKIGQQANARIVIGRRVLYSVEKVKKYLAVLEE